MKKECLSIYDIQNKKGIVVKSQVVLEIEKLGFELYPDYIVNDRKSNLSEEDRGTIYFENINNDEIYLTFSYNKCTKKKFNSELEKYIDKYHYDHFTNYRNQEIHEFVDDLNIFVVFYYEGYMFIITKNGSKYGPAYFELYFTAYSLYKITTKKLEYNHLELEAQSSCIRNNGENIYKYFNSLNIVKVDPVELVMNLKNEQLKDLLDKGINPKVELLLPNKNYFDNKNKAEIKEEEIEEIDEPVKETFDKEEILKRIDKISRELDDLKNLIMKQ